MRLMYHNFGIVRKQKNRSATEFYDQTERRMRRRKGPPWQAGRSGERLQIPVRTVISVSERRVIYFRLWWNWHWPARKQRKRLLQEKQRFPGNASVGDHGLDHNDVDWMTGKKSMHDVKRLAWHNWNRAVWLMVQPAAEKLPGRIRQQWKVWSTWGKKVYNHIYKEWKENRKRSDRRSENAAYRSSARWKAIVSRDTVRKSLEFTGENGYSERKRTGIAGTPNRGNPAFWNCKFSGGKQAVIFRRKTEVANLIFCRFPQN